MIGVGENDRSAKLFQRLLRQRLDRRRSAHRHKRRRLDDSVRRTQRPASRGRRRILLLYFKRKTHLLSVSGENPSPANSTAHINGPHAERNHERFASPPLLGIRGRETDGQQDQCPERENIHRLQQRNQPLRGIVRQDRRKIGRYWVLQINSSRRLQIQDENEKQAAHQPG